MTERQTERHNDRDVRLRALDPSTSFIVQAPAGSGKTELLIQRFLKLLAGVDHPESVVAVTFTRKAAGEMRHRIIDSLQLAATGAAPDEDHKRQTWELCRGVLARDAELGWQLILYPSRLRIQTIDSLCGMLVRQMPWLSRMGASAPPEEKVEYLYRRAARETIEQLEGNNSYADAIERLLKHLDNNLGTVENLLAGMLARRDAWLRHVFPNVHSADLRDALQSAMRQIIADELKRVHAAFPQALVEETLSLGDFAARNLAVEDPGGDLARCAGLKILPDVNHGGLAQWRGIAELFLTKDGSRRKTLNVRNGFPAKPDCKAEKKRCLDLQLPPASIAALHGVRALPPAAFSESQWDVLGALLQLLTLAAAQLKVVFQREGKVDFTEIALASRFALGTSDNPTDLAFALDCRIQHLLVDEFQDTSHGQYELLSALTAEWEPGDGRTLFLVGDPMQSIYGFREAEVALFLKARLSGMGRVRLTPLKLFVNFRSNAGVVDWVNTALGQEFPKAADSFKGAVTYEPSTAFRAGDVQDAIHIYPYFDGNWEAEAERVVAIVAASRQRDSTSKIAVLVRARAHLAAIVAAFRRRGGMRFQAVEIDSLGSRPVVQDLLALTLALLYPADRVSWLSILRAPWCGLTLADLQAVVGSDFDAVIWDALHDASRLESVSEDGRHRIARVTPVLAAALAQRGRLPLRRWLEATWIALGGPACLEDRTGLKDAEVFFDCLEASAAGSDLRDADRFLKDVDGLYARPDVDADDRLQLLTIHKAKGLEFDIVIIPGLGRPTRGTDSRLLRWLEYVDSREQTQLLLAPIRETGTDGDAAYDYVQRIESEKAKNESMRLLYVAATRAKSQLHLLGHTKFDFITREVKPPGSRSLLGQFWNAAAPIYEDAAALLAPPPAETPAEIAASPGGPPLRRLRSAWQAVPSPPDVRWRYMADIPESVADALVNESVTYDWASDLQRRVGIVVHAMLQQAGESSSDARTWPVAAALAAQGLNGDRLREGISRAERALRATVEDERGRWILAKHLEDRREYSICGPVEGRVRHFTLDRTFVDDTGIRWIVDYKTSAHEGGDVDAFLDREQERYRPQLENYARLMARMDTRPIRLGLYFPLLQGWREWA